MSNTTMAVSRRLHGTQKILIFLRAYILCCGLFHAKSKITANFFTWYELCVCSEVLKVQISTCGFKRRKKIKRKPLGDLLKLVLNVLVGSCYRPPNADKTWMENFNLI